MIVKQKYGHSIYEANKMKKILLLLVSLVVFAISCTKSPAYIPVNITDQYIEERIRPAVDEIVHQLKIGETLTPSRLEQLNVHHVLYIDKNTGEYVFLFGDEDPPYDYIFMRTSLSNSPSNGIWVPESKLEKKVLINHNVSVEGLGHAQIAILIDNPGDIYLGQTESKKASPTK